jgi:hypothetical protein
MLSKPLDPDPYSIKADPQTWTCLIWILVRIIIADTDPKQSLAIAIFHFQKRSKTTLTAFTRNPDFSYGELLDPDLTLIKMWI